MSVRPKPVPGLARAAIEPDKGAMLFLGRILLTLAIIGGLGYAALHALATFVAPEPRDISIIIPTPKP
jgi:hypothetical protein